MSKIGKKIDKNREQKENMSLFKNVISHYNTLSKNILSSGGDIAIGKQHSKGRLTVRERIDNLIDSDSVFLEFGKFAAYEMYQDYGKVPAAGVVVGLGKIHNQECMIIGNDATVKAGAYF